MTTPSQLRLKMSGQYRLPEEEVAPPPKVDQVARWVESAQQHGEPDYFGGKRQFVRFTEGMSLEATLNPNRPRASWRVYMHNVSRGGFAFWSKNRVPTWSTVFVREYTEDGSFDWVGAWVTHCTLGIRGFLVGAQFEHPPPSA